MCLIITNVMELTNTAIQTIWLQPLLCIDPFFFFFEEILWIDWCLKNIATVQLSY